GMDAGQPEAGDLEQANNLVAADEREIEIARAGTIRVKGGAVLHPLAGDRASTQDDPRTGRNRCPNGLNELLESLLVSTKRQADHVFPLLLVAELVSRETASLVAHARTSHA